MGIILSQVLDQVSPNPSDAKVAVAKKNAKKNRSKDFLPRKNTPSPTSIVSFIPRMCMYNLCSVDKWRVVIKGESPDYINAAVAHVSSSTNT